MAASQTLQVRAPRLLPLISVLLVSTLPCAVASAHQGTAAGRVPFLAGVDLFAAATSWGIVQQDGARWLRVCEEALGGPPPFYYRQPTKGGILIGRADGVLRTTDGGCTLSAPVVVGGGYPSVGAVPHDEPTVLYVGTSHPDGESGVWRSDDEGETFEATGLSGQDASLRTMVTSRDGQRVWVAGFRRSDSTPVMWASDDAGATFTSVSPWPAGAGFASLIGLDEATGGPALALPGATTGADGEGVLGLLSLDGTTFTELGVFDGVVTDFASFEGRWFVIVSRAQLHVRAFDDAAFTAIEGPIDCLIRRPGDTRLWGCVDEAERQAGATERDGHFLVSDDGLTWTSALPFADVEERECPIGTAGDELCAYRTDDGGTPDPIDPVRGGGSLRDDDDDDENMPPACACVRPTPHAPPGAALAAVLGVLSGAARRRRLCR